MNPNNGATGGKTVPPVPGYLDKIAPYEAGKPIEELERELGIRNSIKLASNENPLGPSPKAVAAASAALFRLHRYPDSAARVLTARLAEKLGVPEHSLVLGNGSDEVIQMLATVFFSPGDEAVMSESCFLMYPIATASEGAVAVQVPLKGLFPDLSAMSRAVTQKTRIIFVNTPLNPTGAHLKKSEFEAFLKDVPEKVLVVLDEAYVEFARDPEGVNGLDYVGRDPRVVVLRTFSKLYGLAGLRVGYGIMEPEIAGYLNRIRIPFNTNLVAQEAAIAALTDEDYVAETLKTVHEGLDFLYAGLSRLGFSYSETQSNFFLIDVSPRDGKEVFNAMLREGVIIRAMNAYGMPGFIRVSVGKPDENQRFLEAFAKVMEKGSGRRPPIVTIDGPSGAGKTTVGKLLAQRLGFTYVDTGALYRGLAVIASEAGVSADDDQGLAALCGKTSLAFRPGSDGSRLFAGERDITDMLRTPEISMLSSAVSARPCVRAWLLSVQRELGKDGGAVFEGRDTGTVVFPDASAKFFLKADPGIRARRRHQELLAKGSHVSLSEVLADMKKRDENDSKRALAPLKPAEDAVMLDSTALTIEEVVEAMLQRVKTLF